MRATQPPAPSDSSPGMLPDEVYEMAGLHQAFERWARLQPAAVAVRDNDRALSYQELDGRANQLARHLRAQGVEPGGLVGVLLERSSDFVVAVLGALKVGAAYLPLDLMSPAERLQAMVADAAPSLLISNAQALAGRSFAVPVLRLAEDEGLAAESEEHLSLLVPSQSRAYVIYTSGSTGVPKGVECTHRGAAYLLADLAVRRPLSPGARCSAWCSTSFDVSVYELFSALSSGGELLIAPDEVRAAADSFCDWLASERVVSAYVPAFMLERLAQLSEDGSVSLERLLVGVEPIAEDLLGRISACGTTVVNGYGPTEAAICATLYTVPQDSSRPGRTPIGRAVEGGRVLLLDEKLEVVSAGQTGEVYVGGVGLAQGYLNRPSLTAERFIPDPFGAGERLYRTGDLARQLPDGNLEFVGRNDHQVKIRGFRVELGEIDAALLRQPEVRDAVTVLKEARPGDKRLVSYVVADTDELEAKLRSSLAELLPEYMVPATVVVLPELPMTVNGKIDREALPEPVYRRAGYLVPPSSPLEEALCGLWSELLGVEEVGVTDNFFSLGGHSLAAATVAARVRLEHSVAIANDFVFQTPIVAEAALAIAAAARQEDTSIPLTPRVAPVPLSLGQRRMWFYERWRPGTPAYNCPYLFRLTGDFDQEACVKAFNEIIRRHELLRTTFALVDEEPVQVIAPPFAVPFEHIDLRGETERASELVEGAARRPFDLATGPVIRVLHLQLGDLEHQLLVSLHHTVVDGMSYEVLGRELSALYADFTAGRPASLSELEVQYADYAAWQRQRLQPESLSAELDDWEDHLRDAPELLSLPTDYPRPPVQRGVGALHKFTVEAPLIDPLRELSAEKGTTLFMTLTAALKALLARYSGQDDIIVGTPSGGRIRPELDGLIGFFVNMLVLRADLSGNPSFADIVERVRVSAERAYANQEVPFELILDRACSKRSLSHAPLFQVTIVQEPPLPELGLPGITASCETVDPGASKFDLSWMVYEEAGGIRLEVEYDTDLFSAQTVARMGEHFRELLQAVGSDPSLSLAELPLTAGAEQQRAWNRTGRNEMAETLPELVALQASVQPQATALVQDGQALSYGELDRWAEAIAAELQEEGFKPDDVAAVYAARSPLLVAAALGVMKAGGAYLPLDPSLPAERLSFMIEDARCSAIVSDRQLSLPGVPDLLKIDAAMLQTADVGERPAVAISAAGLAYVIYTSGSTGKPKGVGLTHRGLRNLVDWHIAAYEVTADDRGSHLAGLGFDASVWELWPYLAVGASVLLWNDSLDPDRLLSDLDAGGVSVSFLPTPLAEAALGASLPCPRSLRLVLTGGDQLRRQPPADFSVPLVNHYGPTEATVVSTAGLVEASERTPPTIGRPIANTTAYVLDEQLNLLPPGLAGVLYVGGEGVARGYLHQPALTAEFFLPDPFSDHPGARLYCTGDRARHLPDGRLEFLGRADNQVKIRGHRIEVGEVEAALLKHPRVGGAVVTVSETGLRRLIAYVVPAGPAPVSDEDLAEIKALLVRSLPSYMIPSAFIPLPELPLNASGKVDRRALPAVPEPSAGHGATPLSEMELALAEIWTQLLQLDEVAAADSFFDVGGDSLLAVQFLSRLRERTGADLSLRQVFEEPTLSGLARQAEQSAKPTSI